MKKPALDGGSSALLKRAGAPAGARIHANKWAFGAPAPAAAYSPIGTYGMPHGRCCGGGQRLHSRDDLLEMDDGRLNKMKADLEKEVEDLEEDIKGLKEKNGAELGKLKKRLSDMDAAYKKLGQDAIARTAKFTSAKAKTSKEFNGLLDGTEKANKEIAQLHASMDKLRSYLDPYVDKFVSGKGWPHGCKCPKAKAVLVRLQATLGLTSVDLDAPRARQSLLRRAARASKPADMEKYKLVRSVQQLEEKRAMLMKTKTEEISSFGNQQRYTLDRIDAAKIKAKVKATTEKKYEDSDADLEKHLKTQIDAAKDYMKSSTSQVDRLKANEKTAQKEFATFKAELAKCKCLGTPAVVSL